MPAPASRSPSPAVDPATPTTGTPDTPAAPAPAAPPPAGVDRAVRARSFGAVAADYHAARTTYSRDAVDWVLEPAGTGTLDVLDLAAGTGLLSAALLAHTPTPRVTAVEPDPGMRAEYARQTPGVAARAGTAESIPVDDATATGGLDAVVAGTAFHWFDLDRALPEIARVLRGGGVLAALWTGPDESVDWVHDYRVAGRLAPPGDTDPRSRHAAGAIPDHPLFEGTEERVFRHVEVRSVDNLVAAVSTYSEVITATPAQREQAITGTEERLRARLDAVGPADPDRPGTVAVPVAVRVIRTRRRPRT